MIGGPVARWRNHDSARGQSLVEFALILPLLLVLLLGIADLGRVFTSAITLEAAVRNAAEAAAQEYVQIDSITPTVGLDATGYQQLHDRALDVACLEAERLPVPDIIPGALCGPAVGAEERAFIAVCVHDDPAGDPGCGSEAAGTPAQCGEMSSPGWSPTRLGPDLPYVEVRMCYAFRMITAFGIQEWGTIWLQKINFFTIPNYCPPLTGVCPP
jgi:hypothetical protein